MDRQALGKLKHSVVVESQKLHVLTAVVLSMEVIVYLNCFTVDFVLDRLVVCFIKLII